MERKHLNQLHKLNEINHIRSEKIMYQKNVFWLRKYSKLIFIIKIFAKQRRTFTFSILINSCNQSKGFSESITTKHLQVLLSVVFTSMLIHLDSRRSRRVSYVVISLLPLRSCVIMALEVSRYSLRKKVNLLKPIRFLK